MPEYIKLLERRKIESYLKIGEDIILGEIEISLEKCKGCGLCIPTCAGRSIEVIDGKACLPAEIPICIGCGDCAAICPEDAIEVTKFIKLNHSFRYLDRAGPEWPRRF